MTPDQRTNRARAIQAGADAIRTSPDPTIWRSWEALAEAVIDAALGHLTTTPTDHEPADLFT